MLRLHFVKSQAVDPAICAVTCFLSWSASQWKKPPEMLPQLISSLWKYTQRFELIEGKKTDSLVSILLSWWMTRMHCLQRVIWVPFFRLTPLWLKHKLSSAHASMGWEIYSSNLGVSVYSRLVSGVFLAVQDLLCLSICRVSPSGNCGRPGRRNKNSGRSCSYSDSSHMWWQNSVFVRSLRWREETTDFWLFRSTVRMLVDSDQIFALQLTLWLWTFNLSRVFFHHIHQHHPSCF